MSRIGTKPIALPPGVTANITPGGVTIAGPKGSLSFKLHPEVSVGQGGQALVVKPARASRKAAALWGTTRAVLARMVEGVARGFEKKLELEGVGYRVTLDGATLVLAVGFSHPVRVNPPPGIAFAVEKNAITIAGIDPVLVGDVAARIRAIRPPEPYKGKGIRYAGEIIRRKVGKKAVTSS